MPDQLHFVASDAPKRKPCCSLACPLRRFGPRKASVIVALGGDGFMLQTLHAFLGRNVPIYGMNFGSVGFLMNESPKRTLSRASPRPHRLAFIPCS